MNKVRLDREEQRILNAIEKGEWESVKPTRQELEHYARIAKNTLKKDQRINIRISKSDLNGIRAKAVEIGIPYQTLVSSLIHRYVSTSPHYLAGNPG